MAQSVGIEETRPRFAGRQQHCRNIQAKSCTDYYRLNLTIPLVNHLLLELTAHFDDESSKQVVDFMHLLPSTISSRESPAAHRDLHNLMAFYEADLPCCVSFESELDLWERKWEKEPQLASTLNTPAKSLPYADKDFYPNINMLLKIMETIPVTSCECECSFSTLKLIKIHLRSTMGQERLYSLSMSFCHRDIDVTPEKVVTEFAYCHHRRMTLINPLH